MHLLCFTLENVKRVLPSGIGWAGKRQKKKEKALLGLDWTLYSKRSSCHIKITNNYDAFKFIIYFFDILFHSIDENLRQSIHLFICGGWTLVSIDARLFSCRCTVSVLWRQLTRVPKARTAAPLSFSSSTLQLPPLSVFSDC